MEMELLKIVLEKELSRKAQPCLPKIRKVVDRVMKKHSKNKYYRKIDLINKVISKCNLDSTHKEKTRIRQMINSWIQNNEEADKQTEVKEEKPKLAIPPVPLAIPVANLKPPPPLIDLTLEDEVKKEVLVVIEGKEIEKVEKEKDVVESGIEQPMQSHQVYPYFYCNMDPYVNNPCWINNFSYLNDFHNI